MANNAVKFSDEECRLLIQLHAHKNTYKTLPEARSCSFLQKVSIILVSNGFPERTIGQLTNKISYLKRHYKLHLIAIQNGGVSTWKYFHDMSLIPNWNDSFEEKGNNFQPANNNTCQPGTSIVSVNQEIVNSKPPLAQIPAPKSPIILDLSQNLSKKRDLAVPKTQAVYEVGSSNHTFKKPRFVSYLPNSNDNKPQDSPAYTLKNLTCSKIDTNQRSSNKNEIPLTENSTKQADQKTNSPEIRAHSRCSTSQTEKQHIQDLIEFFKNIEAKRLQVENTRLQIEVNRLEHEKLMAYQILNLLNRLVPQTENMEEKKEKL